MKKQKKKFNYKKYAIIFFSLALTLGFALLGFNQRINSVKQDRTIVKIKANTDSTIFFYRDNCSDCQSVLPYMVLQKDILHKNIQFVNTNQIKNRHFIAEYKLESVPTFIHSKFGKETKRYSGVNLEKISDTLVGD
ncbi:Thioredoxin [Lactobacillus bombicola]|uniref:Thioredoxin n=1 Tax=Lactobacillus bombicola TaxID=1505723 RepID=A0A1I1U0V1_9LACO|nr:thioredoxin family protein [Lactobacillus bombicola]SFD62323.1 Thioredoxin [Lactobacillus bombicola]